MSRKHYREAAEIIRKRTDVTSPDSVDHAMSPTADAARYATAAGIARDLAAMFKADNPRFRKDRFYRACGLEEYCD